MTISSLSIIINPSGRGGKTAAREFDAQLKRSGIDYAIHETRTEGDAADFARRAVDEGRDGVCVFGGDGTLREAAQSLLQKEIPVVIFAGGTGNVMANELKTLLSIKHGCRRLIAGDYTVRRIDAGDCNGRTFLVRISIGYEAEIVRSAPRQLKTDIGWLAYAFGGFQALLKTRPARYYIDCDGSQEEYEGLSCVIANSTNLGIPGIGFWPLSRLDDGLLELFIIRKADIEKLVSFDRRRREADLVKEFFVYRKIKRVTVSTGAWQRVHCDGDIIQEKELLITAIPEALKVICW